MIQSNHDAYLYIKENVSRETFEKLQIYHDMLVKWNKAINLVSASTIDEIWLRHILDSYQITDKITGDFADLGSGAGFPGLVCSILSQKKVSLIEADQKKCSFMRNVSRETLASCEIICQRIENTHKSFRQITSRALAPIAKLVALSQHLRGPETTMILLKGERTQSEIEEAQKEWEFQYALTRSLTSATAYIVELRDIIPKL